MSSNQTKETSCFKSGEITKQPTFRTFFRIKIILPQIQLEQSTDASGLAGKTVLAKEQDRQTCCRRSTAYF
jgi:hypothetical protein